MIFKNGLITYKTEHDLIKFFPDNNQVIAHSDGTIKMINPEGYLKVIYPNKKVKKFPSPVNKVSMVMCEKELLSSETFN